MEIKEHKCMPGQLSPDFKAWKMGVLSPFNPHYQWSL